MLVQESFWGTIMFLHFVLVLCAKNIAKRDFFRKYNIFFIDEVDHV